MTDGGFDSRGSFRVNRPKNPGGLDGFVAHLVALRRASPLKEPWEFASIINTSIHRTAFPNAIDSTDSSMRWTATILSNPIPWCAVGVGTSAESAVKYACWSQCLMPYDPATTLQALLASISVPLVTKRRRIAEMEAPILSAVRSEPALSSNTSPAPHIPAENTPTPPHPQTPPAPTAPPATPPPS